MSQKDSAEDDNDSVPPAERMATQHDYDSITSLLDNDPERAYDDEIVTALALSKKNGTELWSRFSTEMTNYETIDYNAYQSYIAKRAEELEQKQDTSNGNAVEETTPDDAPKPEGKVPEWESVAETVEERFDKRSRQLMDAFMTVPVRMLMTGIENCPIVIAIGPASTGKSTVVKMFQEMHFAKTYGRVSEASWISHNMEAEEGEYDLLPRIKQRVMVTSEMGTWFTGDDASAYMRTLADVADGDGITRTTGAHGTTRYKADYPGEYRFGIIGATVYPTKRAWKAMANAGSRFLFHPMRKEDNIENLLEMANNGDHVQNRVECKKLLTKWWHGFWHKWDGEIKPEDRPEPTDEQAKGLMILARIMSRGRAPAFGADGQGSGVDQSEQELRAYKMLLRSVQARAMAYGRSKSIVTQDLAMAARMTFASIPQWRQPVAMLLCHPDSSGVFKSTEVQKELGVARSTAIERMKEAGNIGLAAVERHKTKGGETMVFKLTDKKMRGVFQKGIVPWPDNISMI